MAEGNVKKDDVYSKAVRAGKRTYFFDVKATKSQDYYLTITESKKRFEEDGKFFFEKHKLFLYKEDFDKFINGLEGTISKIKEIRAKQEAGESLDSNEDDSDRLETEGDFDFDNY
jgi:hypothetical protein